MDECIHCQRQLSEDDQRIKVFLFVQTFGMRPRLKSPAESVSFCAPCANSLAFGPSPVGAINVAVWRRLRELVGVDPAVTKIAWEGLHQSLTPRQLSDGIAPIARPLAFAGEGARSAS